MSKDAKKPDKIAELTDICKRVQADFENYKKRVEREREEMRSYISADMIKRLLPLLDNFELALKNKDKTEDFVKGMELIYSQFVDILKNEGVEKIDTSGNFDPNLHEAMMAEETGDPNKVLEEFQAGYKLKNRVIRPSKVKVSK